MLEIPRKPAIVSAFYETWGSMSRRRLCEGGYIYRNPVGCWLFSGVEFALRLTTLFSDAIPIRLLLLNSFSFVEIVPNENANRCAIVSFVMVVKRFAEPISCSTIL